MRAMSMRASGFGCVRSSKVFRWSTRSWRGFRGARRVHMWRTGGRCGKAWPSSRDFAATFWCGCACGMAWSNDVTCAIHHGCNGRCSRRSSRTTSSRIFRSATSRSTVPIPVRTFEAKMRKLLFQSLFRQPLTEAAPSPDDAAVAELAAAVGRVARQRLGRSLSIREVDAGSCNGCELEIHAINNAYYDVERFGIRFVASPRHADVLMVTGPVTKNMRDALERTYHATPNPKWVVAIGDCARDGGCFAGSYAVAGGVSEVIPVDLHIAGCPPTPTAMLKGLLALLERVDADAVTP